MPKTLRKFRDRTKPKTQYLVQEREGMDDVVYIGTDALKKRSDMHPISEEEAKAFLGEQWPEFYAQAEQAEAVTVAPEVPVEETGATVIADLAEAVHVETDADFVEVPEPIVPKTDPAHAVGIDRNTDPECLLIESFTKKNQVEHYLLATHQLEIDITDRKLLELKEEAISAVIAKRL